jgi:hypothetical protein
MGLASACPHAPCCCCCCCCTAAFVRPCPRQHHAHASSAPCGTCSSRPELYGAACSCTTLAIAISPAFSWSLRDWGHSPQAASTIDRAHLAPLGTAIAAKNMHRELLARPDPSNRCRFQTFSPPAVLHCVGSQVAFRALGTAALTAARHPHAMTAGPSRSVISERPIKVGARLFRDAPEAAVVGLSRRGPTKKNLGEPFGRKGVYTAPRSCSVQSAYRQNGALSAYA